jgi:hypothetical protein
MRGRRRSDLLWMEECESYSFLASYEMHLIAENAGRYFAARAIDCNIRLALISGAKTLH